MLRTSHCNNVFQLSKALVLLRHHSFHQIHHPAVIRRRGFFSASTVYACLSAGALTVMPTPPFHPAQASCIFSGRHNEDVLNYLLQTVSSNSALLTA